MKIKLTFLVTATFLFGFLAKAQQNYTHTVSNAPYQDISSPTIINGTDSIDEFYYLNIDFSFPIFGAFADFKFTDPNQNPGPYFSRAGYLAVIEGPNFNHTDVFAPYYNDNLVRRDATSSLSAELSGTTGKRFLKFQWKNMGVANHTAAEFVNFQVWFDEANKSVSCHYGPSNLIDDPTEFNVINFFHSTNDAVPVFTTAVNLTGDAAVPSGLSVAHPASYNDMQGVSNFPPSGTVIKFKQNTTGINAATAIPACNVYPNPAAGGVFDVQLPEYSANTAIEVYNMQGALIYSAAGNTGRNTIDLANKADGIYILKVIRENEIIGAQKLIKQ